MKITIYTITDCQFSKAEKEYLQSKNIQFEEKNLETNREYLTEMLNLSNNFAGTPVTKIEKDDGQTEVLKGFTQEEFDKALGFAAPTAATQVSEKPAEAAAPVATDNPAPVPPIAAMPPVTPTETVPAPAAVEPAPVAMSTEPPAPPAPAVDPTANTAYPQSAPIMDAPMSVGVDPLSSSAPTLDMQAPLDQPVTQPAQPEPVIPTPQSPDPLSANPVIVPDAPIAPAAVTQPEPTSADMNTQNALNAVLNNLQEKSDDENQTPAA